MIARIVHLACTHLFLTSAMTTAIYVGSKTPLLADTLGESYQVFVPAKDITVGPAANFTGMNLRGSHFIEMDLQGANFAECSIQQVRFLSCNLSRASFRRVDLATTVIDNCELKNANFSDAKINGMLRRSPNEFCNFHLSEAQLKSTRSYSDRYLDYCLISGRYPTDGKTPKYNFSNASLHSAAFISGDFSDCDFTGADLTAAHFSVTRIHFSTLSRCKAFQEKEMKGTDLARSRVYGNCDFSDMKLIGVTFSAEFCDTLDMRDAIIENCYFRGIDAGQLQATKSYQMGKLAETTFDRCDLSGCDLSGANLSEVVFSRTSLDRVSFNDAVISNAQFAERVDWHLNRFAALGTISTIIWTAFRFSRTLQRNLARKISGVVSKLPKLMKQDIQLSTRLLLLVLEE